MFEVKKRESHHKDYNGVEVKIGDVVYIPVVVRSLRPGPNNLNFTAETVHPIYPSRSKSSISLNTKQALKLSIPDEDTEDTEDTDE